MNESLSRRLIVRVHARAFVRGTCEGSEEQKCLFIFALVQRPSCKGQFSIVFKVPKEPLLRPKFRNNFYINAKVKVSSVEDFISSVFYCFAPLLPLDSPFPLLPFPFLPPPSPRRPLFLSPPSHLTLSRIVNFLLAYFFVFCLFFNRVSLLLSRVFRFFFVFLIAWVLFQGLAKFFFCKVFDQVH